MLRIDRVRKTLSALENRTLADASYKERFDLQAMIRQSPQEFFNEMGETLLLVGEEVRPADLVGDRIDLLAVDDEGTAVIIELKRGNDRLQLLQAISYAAMVARWEPERFLDERARFAQRKKDEATDDFEELLGPDTSSLNVRQRIILIAEGFDWEVLATAEWLNKGYGVDIKCYRVALSSDGPNDFLSCTCIYPPPELAEHARQRRAREVGGNEWSAWDEVFKFIDNPYEREFFEREVAAGVENRLRGGMLLYRAGDGRRHFWTSARRTHAYVWQEGRFADDVQFWSGRLGSNAGVEPVNRETCLRFFLEIEQDFKEFAAFTGNELKTVEFLGPDETEGRP